LKQGIQVTLGKNLLANISRWFSWCFG